MSRLLAFVSSLALVLLLPLTASADLISDDEAECRGKDAGAACSLRGDDGACVKSTCYRNDYSNGPPPTQVAAECLVCDPDASPAGSEATTGAPSVAKKAGCTVASLVSPLPLSLGSLALGAVLLFALQLRRRDPEA